MKIDDVKELKPLERFIYWINEREKIRCRRLMGEARPWTTDKILQSYRFCNVVRMDDKVSLWLMENWYNPHFNHPNMIFMVGLARFINQPSSLGALGFIEGDWNPHDIAARLREIRDKKKGIEPFFNSAYMVRGNDGQDKIESVVNYYVDSLKEVAIIPDYMEKTWEEIMNVGYGYGSFMAGQLVADLRWAIKGKWVDRNTWAPIGPGSKRGMNRLRDKPIDTKLSQESFLKRLIELRDTCKSHISKSLRERMELHDWQNCLCEYDKYERVLHGEGRPKQLYQGT